jgi:hypothetical protein
METICTEKEIAGLRATTTAATATAVTATTKTTQVTSSVFQRISP